MKKNNYIYNLKYNGKQLNFNTRSNVKSDIGMIDEIFKDETYGFYKEKIKNCIVFDIGSYIGESCIWFYLNGAKKIYGYEPHPLLFKMALDNVANFDKIKLYNFGWGVKSEEKLICGNAASSFGNGKTFFKQKSHEQLIKFTTAKEQIIKLKEKNEKIFVKIDVEGAEVNIINDIFHYNLNKYINYAIIECHGKNRIKYVKEKLKNNNVTIDNEIDSTFSNINQKLLFITFNKK